MKTQVTILFLIFSSLAIKVSADSPNFLVILTDDQSWVGTSLLMDPDRPDSKSDYYQTPHIDALMSAGMRFTDGYASAAWCIPTRRSIQSGTSPSRHLYHRSPDGNEANFATGPSIPRVLKAANADYVCAHFGKWHLDYENVTPETLGYDVSDGDTTNFEGEQAAQEGGDIAQVNKTKNIPDVWEDPKTIFSLTRRTGDFVEEQTKAGKPWFVQLSHYAVHLKISYREATLESLKDRPVGEKHTTPEFAAMTEDLDAGIGQLWERLKSLDVLDNTYVIFLSDNGGRGEIPIEGRSIPETGFGRNFPLAESKHSIYEGGLRVPFAIVGPGIEAGSVSRATVSGVDILPTLADFAGRTLEVDKSLDGGSIKPVALGEAKEVQRARPFLVTQSKGSGEKPRDSAKPRPSDFKAAIRLGSYKLIKFYGSAGDGHIELYHLVKDLGEEHNLAEIQPERAAQLEKKLDAYLKEVGGITEQAGKSGRKKGKQ